VIPIHEVPGVKTGLGARRRGRAFFPLSVAVIVPLVIASARARD
jgi:hypothetical protein